MAMDHVLHMSRVLHFALLCVLQLFSGLKYFFTWNFTGINIFYYLNYGIINLIGKFCTHLCFLFISDLGRQTSYSNFALAES